MEASGAGCWSTGAIASIGDPRKAALTALLPALSAAPVAGAQEGVFVDPTTPPARIRAPARTAT